ncbi:unnamed protein product [Gongylonema pulchrum]|uniref:PKD_channel domain-containing protein n=1 Tax=Gongylonema pulchrum TaxID=637853 RepID=A0A183DDD2_9BILA|nr:unnamed protein product [Gongylonema pulchrum]
MNNVGSDEGGEGYQDPTGFVFTRPRMYSALPQGSSLKWDREQDNSGYYIIPYIITGDYGTFFVVATVSAAVEV